MERGEVSKCSPSPVERGVRDENSESKYIAVTLKDILFSSHVLRYCNGYHLLTFQYAYFVICKVTLPHDNIITSLLRIYFLQVSRMSSINYTVNMLYIY